jgi:Na+-driven multidrug efflux pump
MLGFGQGFQPMCGYNYGARLFERVRKGYFFCVKYSFLFLTTLAVIEFFFAGNLIGVFRDDPAVIEIGTRALRFQCLSLPTFSVIIISNMMLQTSGKVVSASLVGSARQGFFLIPAVFILPPLLGLQGIQMAQPIADYATLLMTIPLAGQFLQEMKQQNSN